ncbi:MarR family transcriptional regulator [Actinoplanes sp. CA-054009]
MTCFSAAGRGARPTLSPGEDEVVGALLALSRAFVAEIARSLSGLDEDVTLPQFRTLVVLVSQGPQRIVDLANELTVTSSTAVRMCCRRSCRRAHSRCVSQRR